MNTTMIAVFRVGDGPNVTLLPTPRGTPFQQLCRFLHVHSNWEHMPGDTPVCVWHVRGRRAARLAARMCLADFAGLDLREIANDAEREARLTQDVLRN
jgi:hypothetical protein